jgi:VIT1/CCC1 family predicted Fe2+/Mn2+ transporter
MRREGRPATGFAHYLRDVVYGALDGVITTMAVVAGTTGAHLGPKVGIILGLANLFGDGISMGASNYLGLKSELQQAGKDVGAEAPWRHGLATLAAFVVVGSAPLLAYLLPRPPGWSIMLVAALLAGLVLLATGAVRARFVNRTAGISALEMLLVGILAGLAAYLVGLAGAALLTG